MLSSRSPSRPGSSFSRLVAGALAAFSLTVTLVTGCSLFVTTNDLSGGEPPCEGGSCASTSDAPTSTLGDDSGPLICGDADVTSDENNCGQCGVVCSGGTPRCLAGSCVAGCPGGIVYVSPAGSDTNDGCTTTTPLATVTKAIGNVMAQKATGESIHICHGTFTEPDIDIDYPVSLYGGYDCGNWGRSATYGYPNFDGVNQTILATTAQNPSGNTLAVTSVDSSVVIDGLTIQGPSTGMFVKLGAVLLSGQATPVFTNNVILGGTNAPNVTTAGLRISLQSGPLVKNNRIDGGGGALGAQGIDVSNESGMYIESNMISGGSSPQYGWGIISNSDVAQPGRPEYVMNNMIDGGGGTTTIGLDVADGSVSIIGNTITGGTAQCAGGDCDSTGIRIFADEAGSFAFTVARNRITSGTVSVPSSGSQTMIGITASSDSEGAGSLTQLDIVDNAVQAGSSGNTEGLGVYINGVVQTNVQGNTIYGFTGALILESVPNVDVGGNLFLTDAKAGVGVFACTGTSGVNSFSSNAFVNAAALVVAGNCSNGQLDTITAVESHYASSAVRGATGNRRVAASCGVDSSTQCAPVATCVAAQTSQSACIGHVLGTWDDPSQGAADLLDNSRTWKLATTAPCTIAQAYSTPLTDSFVADGGTNYDTVDIVGAQRTAPVTIGAYEDNGTCAP